MLSVEECKKTLGENHNNEEILKIRETLYQIANILIQNYLETKE
jgi:hypothetical protein